MATVTGFTAERMLVIENETIVDAELVGYDLVLTTREGTPINVGNVRGAAGPTGPAGPDTQRTARIPHTFTIPGIIAIPSGDTDYIPGMFIDLPAGKTAAISLARARINGGTSATVQLRRNGSGLHTAAVVTTTAGDISMTGAPVALADNDYLQIVISAISGTPQNLSFTIYVDYTF